MRSIREMAAGIRRRVLDHTVRNAGGYMSQACSSAEILASLYGSLMRLGPVERPLAPRPFPGPPSATNLDAFLGVDFNGGVIRGADRFILSPTHYSLVLYAALIEAGRMTEDALGEFNKDGSCLEMIGAEHSPGMEVMTGSLGQGLGQAAGIALGKRLKGDPGRVFVFMSDGEFQIGMTWESFQFMGHHGLSNMRILVDVNGQQCDGTVPSVMRVDPLDARLSAFGARVACVDGHDVEALLAAGNEEPDGGPLVVLCRTDPCRGLELLRRNAPKLHYLRFRTEDERDEYARALAEMTDGNAL